MSTNRHHATAEAGADHLRYELGQLEKMREQILHDMESLRTQESNLRAYEARLRTPAGAAPAASVSRSPVATDSLEAEWEKFQRSRALLEAERRAVTDDRLVLREQAEALRQREDALKQREAWVATRERDLAVKAMPPPPQLAKKKAPSLTQAPFLAAKNLLSLGRAH